MYKKYFLLSACLLSNLSVAMKDSSLHKIFAEVLECEEALLKVEQAELKKLEEAATKQVALKNEKCGISDDTVKSDLKSKHDQLTQQAFDEIDKKK